MTLQTMGIGCVGLAVVALTVMVLLLAPEGALRLGPRGWRGEWLFAALIVGLVVTGVNIWI